MALLLLAYEPSAERAYGSVLSLRDDTAIGGFVRNIHFWAANSLVLVTVLHLLRVFYTGAFRAPRRFNWVIGLLLFALVLASNFTGYLRPWDQLAFWAVTIGTGMLEYVPLIGPTLEAALRGGPEVGPKTLSIFFVLHIAILPILGAILAAFHFWLVRKAGGVILPGRILENPLAPRLLKEVQMQGGSRCEVRGVLTGTSQRRARAPTPQMGLFQQPASACCATAPTWGCAWPMPYTRDRRGRSGPS